MITQQQLTDAYIARSIALKTIQNLGRFPQKTNEQIEKLKAARQKYAILSKQYETLVNQHANTHATK